MKDNKKLKNKDLIIKCLDYILMVSCVVLLILGVYFKDIAKICVIVAICTFFVIRVYQNKGKFWKNFFPKTFLNKAIALFLVIAGLSVIFGVDPYHSQKIFFARYLPYFLMFFIGVYLAQKNKNGKIIIFMLLTGAVIVSIGGLIDVYKAGSFIRLFTSFGVHMMFGGYFLYTLPFFIGLAVFHPSFKIKVISIIGAIPVLASFLLNYYRGAWIGLILALVIIGFLFGKHKLRFLGVVLIIILVIFTIPRFRTRIFSEQTLRPVTWGDRVPMWEASVNIFNEYPFLGAGPGNYGRLMYKFQDVSEYREGKKHIHAHNTYLEILAEMGILGLLSFLLIFILFFYKGCKAFIKKADSYKISFIIMILSVAILELTSSTVLVGVANGILFWFLLGIGTKVFGFISYGNS